MALSRSKTQPDRPIWPVAPEARSAPGSASSHRDRSLRPTTGQTAAGSQQGPSTMAQSEGFGSFAS